MIRCYIIILLTDYINDPFIIKVYTISKNAKMVHKSDFYMLIINLINSDNII